jgi:hypothetical protein
MAQDVIITPASGEINFKDSGTSVALIDIDGSNNLSITNPGGNLSIGDTASDVYIGDGTNNVDLIFEQNGSIRGTGSQTITLGQSGDTISVAASSLNPQCDIVFTTAATRGIYFNNTSGNQVYVRLLGSTELDLGSDNRIRFVESDNGSVRAVFDLNSGKAKVGNGASETPVATWQIEANNESTTQTNFTQAVVDAGLLIETQYTSGAYTPGLFWITNNNNSSKPKAGIYLKTDGTGSKILFGTSNDYGTGLTNTAMLINESGNVGIGTTSPTAPLDVLGVRAGRDFTLSNRAGVRLDANGTGSPSDVLFGHTAAANQTSWTGVYWSLSSRGTTSSVANSFYFYRGSGQPSPNNSEAVLMTFTPDLKVGISTQAPNAKLHVVGETYSSNYRLSGPGDGGPIPAYDNSDYATVKYNQAERATELVSSSDTQIGMAFPAFRVNESTGEQWKVWVQHKMETAVSSGVYLRIYEYNAELPSNKIAVSNSASNAVVQEDTSGKTNWYENGASATTWATSTYTYTPSSGAKWASVVVLSWSGIGINNSLFVRTGKSRISDGGTGGTGGTGGAGGTGGTGGTGGIGSTGGSGTSGSSGTSGTSGGTGGTGGIGSTGATGGTGGIGSTGATGGTGGIGSTGGTGGIGSTGSTGGTGGIGSTGGSGTSGTSGGAGGTGGTGGIGSTGGTGGIGSTGSTGGTGGIGSTGSTGGTGGIGSTGGSGTSGSSGTSGTSGGTGGIGSTGSTGGTGGIGSTGGTGGFPVISSLSNLPSIGFFLGILERLISIPLLFLIL